MVSLKPVESSRITSKWRVSIVEWDDNILDLLGCGQTRTGPESPQTRKRRLEKGAVIIPDAQPCLRAPELT